MTTRTIEIDDDLDERVKCCNQELLDNFIEYFLENPDMIDFDEYYQAQGCDMCHEFADSNTPIHYSDIDGLWYLYSSEFEEAYSDVFGNEMHESQDYKHVAIYCYISNESSQFMNELAIEFNDCLIGDPEVSMVAIEDILRRLI